MDVAIINEIRKNRAPGIITALAYALSESAIEHGEALIEAGGVVVAATERSQERLYEPRRAEFNGGVMFYVQTETVKAGRRGVLRKKELKAKRGKVAANKAAKRMAGAIVNKRK